MGSGPERDRLVGIRGRGLEKSGLPGPGSGGGPSGRGGRGTLLVKSEEGAGLEGGLARHRSVGAWAGLLGKKRAGKRWVGVAWLS